MFEEVCHTQRDNVSGVTVGFGADFLQIAASKTLLIFVITCCFIMAASRTNGLTPLLLLPLLLT